MGSFGVFCLSFFKLDRRGEESRDMVTLRKKNMLRDWMSNAATDGWCADCSCVTLAPTTISVQHICEDHDEDTVHLGAPRKFGQYVEGAQHCLSPRGFRRH